MDDFEKEIKQGFLEEAAQLITDAEQCFLTLESNPNDSAITDQLFRLAHNLKGSGNAVGFLELGKFTHKLESLLLKVKNKEIQIKKPTVDLLLACNDHLQNWIALLRMDMNGSVDSSALAQEIENQLNGKFSDPTEPPAVIDTATEPTPETEVQSEINPDPETQFVETKIPVKAQKAPAAGQADESIRVSLARLEKLINFVGEMVILQSVLKEQIGTDKIALLRKSVHQLGKVSKEVQDISMSLRMVPLKQTFQKMQRIVRDTSSSLSKTVQLTIEGDETEVDKTILESLGDPLVHLIRNAVDHGVESGERRVAAGKKSDGNVWLKAYHQSGHLIIEVKDDGAGLDPAKLTAKAIEKGVLKPGATLTDQEAYQLIFAPGFSTKLEVTDVSGRGVGMDVVRTNIEALQGDIHIETQVGTGTTFKIRLPLTLAIIDGMIVKTAKERFVIPLSHVHETVRPTQADLHFATGIGEIFSLRGESLPIYRLNQLLDKKNHDRNPWECVAIVVRLQGQPFAVLVDEIVGQAQVVIKKLGDEHAHLSGFSGSAILGDGRPALILELPELSLRAKPNNSMKEPRRVA